MMVFQQNGQTALTAALHMVQPQSSDSDPFVSLSFLVSKETRLVVQC